MRSLPVSYEREAITDLQNVRSYILNISSSPVIAEHFMRRLLTFCDRIGDVPNGGYPLRRRRHRRRIFKGSWIVVYRVTDTSVEILRVVSARRNLKKYRR